MTRSELLEAFAEVAREGPQRARFVVVVVLPTEDGSAPSVGAFGELVGIEAQAALLRVAGMIERNGQQMIDSREAVRATLRLFEKKDERPLRDPEH